MDTSSATIAAAGGVGAGGDAPLSAGELAPYQYLFLTGKGGVGKTSVSCAVACALADAGRRVLLVTTDPASNLGDVFGQVIGMDPTPIPACPGLEAEEVDPVQLAAQYRESVVGPYRGVLPDDAIANIEEQLSGSCTVEIAAFDRFASLLSSDEIAQTYDNVIFDTAPTGHTLRMLELPSAWTSYLNQNTTGTSCLGQLAGLGPKRDAYRRAMEVLRDGNSTALVLVSRAQTLALGEAARAAAELSGVGIRPRLLVVNGVLGRPGDGVARQMFRAQQEALAAMPPELAGVPRRTVPLRASDVTGVERLRALLGAPDATPQTAGAAPQESGAAPAGEKYHAPNLPGLDALVDDLFRRDVHVVMTMGKGGVGKTTVAVHVAQALRARGRRVRLTTTDPADHLGQFDLAGLAVSHIDQAAELASYQDEVLQKARRTMGEADVRYVEEDLRSPCTQEIATFRAFANIVARARDEVVVIDTAPTGHTLLLLDNAQSYGRQIEHTGGDVPQSVRDLLPRLRDPRQTEVVIVTLPENTPAREAERLSADLDRARIPHGWWVVNRCLSMSGTTDPTLSARAQAEARWIDHARAASAGKVATVAWQAPDAAPDAAPAPGAAPVPDAPTVAFVCTHNACRSQMAEALARQLLPHGTKTFSAGTNPASHVDAGALAELTRRGVSTNGLRPKPIFQLPRVDWLVTMGCGVSCPSLPCAHREDWGLDDPMGGSPRAYQDCADAIVRHLRQLGEKIARA